MNKKPLTIITYEFPPRIGGAGGVAKDISKSYELNKHETIVLTCHRATFKRFKVEKTNSNFNTKVSFPVLFNLWFIFFPIYLFFHRRYFSDNIILNDFGAMYSFYIIPHFSRSTYTCYIHGKEPFLYKKSFLRNEILRFPYIYRKVVTNSKSLIFVSEFVKNWFFENVIPIGSCSTVIYNAVDLSLFNNVVESPSVLSTELYTQSENNPKMVTACRLVKEKGFDRKLDIFVKLHQKGVKFTWFIAGDGSYKSEFQKKVASLGFGDYVIFLGRVEREKLKPLYLKCNFFWLLSSYEEAYPLVYHEAHACGLPVIGLNRGGVKEVINDGFDGFVVDTQDEAFNLIYNDEIGKINLQKWDREAHSIALLYAKVESAL
ncbi:glycosyltransferase family 4 protein [Pseudoalteromonas citrea]|uniref:glycosyltransferase family 4 protein n=1 Tax=Pseudoalteromonas citrea TaxID=43655 RepID=UPI00148671AF|nr:glycosyltransferase family 4 protein [Pseudoalteromonas citrea]